MTQARVAASIFALALALPLAADTIVTRCETTTVAYSPTFNVRHLGTCSDAAANDALWHLDRLDSLDGHLDGRYHRARSNALVYVMDVGLEKDHDEFAEGNVVGGIDAVALAGEASNCHGQDALHACISLPILVSLQSHGTGVASLIGGRHVGVAPGTRIVSVRATSGTAATWMRALNEIVKYAWDPSSPQVRTAIVNMSSQMSPLETPGDVTHAEIERKIRDMIGGVDRDGNPDPNGKRFLFVVAAGNDEGTAVVTGGHGQCGADSEVILFPALMGPSTPGLVTVGGLNKDNTIWPQSCRGSAVELLAPAEDVMPASNTGLYDYRQSFASGTSWSTPIVSGVAALILTQYPNLTPAEVEQRLEATTSLASGTTTAGGRVVSIVPPPDVPPPNTRRRAAAH